MIPVFEVIIFFSLFFKEDQIASETLCKDAKAVFHWSGKSIALEKVLPLPTPLGREAGGGPCRDSQNDQGALHSCSWLLSVLGN